MTDAKLSDAKILPTPERFAENLPDRWLKLFPKPASNAHKGDRGHALILASPCHPGATHLASAAASRTGAGSVSVLASEGQKGLYLTSLPPDIRVETNTRAATEAATAILVGCGGSDDVHTHAAERASHLPRVFDGEALREALDFGHLNADTVLTPQEIEFRRVFADIEGTREEKAVAAARRSGAVIVFKGARTCVAAPDGRIAVNDAPNPWLAKSGTGDVLAGIIVSLLAQGMPAFEAACAGVFVHSRVGDAIGPGLVPHDMEIVIPAILHDIFHI